jgi:hypothetical protein
MCPARRLALATLLLFVVAGTAAAQADPQPVRVLFVGNSYTYVNDLPKMVAALAKAGNQRPLEYDRETPGGCTLEKHWNDGKAVKKITARNWDFVVLQEHSLRPLTNRKLMFEYAGKLDAEVKKQKAQTLLYMTWIRQSTPEIQPSLSQAYTDLGKELAARVAPVGRAWERALKDNPKLALHSADGSHPSKAGTYLAACVFYATIYNKSPEGLPGSIGGLSDAEARPLQVIAWQVVKEQGEKK